MTVFKTPDLEPTGRGRWVKPDRCTGRTEEIGEAAPGPEKDFFNATILFYGGGGWKKISFDIGGTI